MYILFQLASDSSKTGKVWVSDRSSYNLVNTVPKSNRISKPTPIPLMKAIKNEVEINGKINSVFLYILVDN